MHYRRTAGLAALLLLTAIAAVAGAATIRNSRAPAYASPLAVVAPANDNFAGRQQLTPPFSPPGGESLPADRVQSTAGATMEAGENAPCGNIGATVWFEFQADRDLTVEIDTAQSDFDTVLAVYTLGNFVPSPPAGASLTSVACDDNSAGAQSRVVRMTRSQTYLVQVGGAGGASGMLHLHADCLPACTPRNDNVSDATNIDTSSMPFAETRSTAAATVESGEPRACGGIGATVWYHVTAYQPVTIEATTAGSNFDTVLAVYRQDGFLPSPPGGLSQVACEDNGAGAQSTVTLHADAGVQYYIQAGGANGATGELTFGIRCVPGCPPPNDSYPSAYGVGVPMTQAESTDGATTDAGEPLPCGGIGKTVWYQLFGGVPRAQRIGIDTSGSDFDTVVAVYRATGDLAPAPLQLVSCTDHASAATVALDAEANTQYVFQIGGHNGASGTLQVQFDCDPSPCPPANDGIAHALTLASPFALPGAFGADIRGATTEPGEPLDCGRMGKTAWYALPGYTKGTLSVDARASDFSAALAVYTGPPGATDFAGFPRIGCETGTLDWQIVPGQTYYLQAGGADGAGGQLNLFVDCTGSCPPPNDNAENAIFSVPMVPGSPALTARTAGATLEDGEPQPCGAITSSVWYQFNGPADVTLSTAGSDYANVIALYVVDGFSPPPMSLTNVGCSTVANDGSAVLHFKTQPGVRYFAQVGATSTGGNLRFSANCDDCAAPASGGQVVGPDTGGPFGGIGAPNTGSGGYLPGARR